MTCGKNWWGVWTHILTRRYEIPDIINKWWVWPISEYSEKCYKRAPNMWCVGAIQWGVWTWLLAGYMKLKTLSAHDMGCQLVSIVRSIPRESSWNIDIWKQFCEVCEPKFLMLYMKSLTLSRLDESSKLVSIVSRISREV